MFAVMPNESTDEWTMSNDEKSTLIDKLTEYLPTLRGTIKLSQEQIANAVGISRQTYNSIELKKRKMSWSTFMALMYFYDQQPNTKLILQKMELYPTLCISPDDVESIST